MSDDSDYAFPHEDDCHYHHGMTMRDYFAAKAMAAIHASDFFLRVAQEGSTKLGLRMGQYIARQAWQMADEMLAERDRDTEAK